jgi:diguanylate cyclase (GGDEF)-like protein
VAGFLRHVVASAAHEVLLLSPTGRVIDSSPHLGTTTLAGWSPALARAVRTAQSGAVPATAGVSGRGGATRFAAAPVSGTAWRLLITEPDSELYAADGGLEAVVPWVFLALVGLLASALLALFLRALAERRAVEESYARVAREARTDALTGLANRRQLEAVLRRMARNPEPYSVLMIDLDDFKQINDRHGHAAGDRVLRQLAELMRGTFREGDLFGRWGGDEFLAVLPGAGVLDATGVAAQLQRAARDLRSSLPAHTPVPRVTIGTATWAPGVDVLAAADRALYEAKAARRPATADVGA